MIDKFDYAEPMCPTCDGKDFYYPDKDKPTGTIPVDRIIDKVDGLFNKNDYVNAGKLLEYWRNESVSLGDKRGELAIESELIGYYRKQNDMDKGLLSVSRALELLKQLDQKDTASGATILINCATAYKSFGMDKEALPLYLEAEKIYKRRLSDNDERFGGLYNNMALALVDLGEMQRAEKAYLSALDIMGKVQRGEAECAITYINMAHMYEAIGNIEKMYSCMDKAYELLQSENLIHDGYFAFVIEKCAPSFEYFGKKDICDRLKKEAEEIYERS